MNKWSGIEVVAPIGELAHPMWQRMWTRAGFNVEDIPVIPLEPTITPRPDTHTLILLGESALRSHGDASDLFRYRGRRYLRYEWGRPIIVAPTVLPSQLLPRKDVDHHGSKLALRPARFQGAWIHDVQEAVRQAGSLVLPKLNYLEDPDPDTFKRWAEHALQSGDPYLSFDIETQYKLKIQAEEELEEDDEAEQPIGAMLRISFAHQVHHAVSVQWLPEYFSTIRLLLESSMKKVVWNGAQFDVPRLRAEGFPVNGRVYDFQDAWHILQSDQNKGLEYVSSFYSRVMPWKHLNGSQPAMYSCIDADVALENALGIEQDLKHFGQWDLFERHVVDLMPILEEAGLRGNLIDQEFSDKLRIELESYKASMLEDAQKCVPEHLKPTKRYKKNPLVTKSKNDLTENSENCLILNSSRVFREVSTSGVIKYCTACQAENVKKTDHFKGGKKNPCKIAGGEITTKIGSVTEWDEILPFNLGSSDQVKNYIRHFKHPMAKDRKTGNDTANSQAIQKLAAKYGTEHPVYNLLKDYSKITKTLSTYIYTPDSQGLIHTSYVNAPSTWRLASRNVNLQNVGKRESNPWAKKARKQIIARPGHVFVQADSTSIEAVIVGWLIGDQKFIEVAKKSIHAYLCCAELKWEFTDENIDRVKTEHKALYNQFKTAVYLLLYGGDPYLMFMTNPEVFPTKEAAEIIQKKIFTLMPKLAAWHDTTREQAKKESVLRSPWGYRHYFYDVYTFKRYKNGDIEYNDHGLPKMKLGQDAKRALAFRPQNCAGGFCRDTLFLIGESKWREFMPPNISVHDGYTLEVPEALKFEAADYLIEILTRPIPQMDGLRIGCEVEFGYNWADAGEWNPNGMTKFKKVEV